MSRSGHSGRAAARKRARQKPLLSSYPTRAARRGRVFATTTSAARRRRRRTAAAAVLLIAVACAGVFGWLWTRPVSVTVAAAPADALITFPGSLPATGTLGIDSVEPGDYPVTIVRSGFETRTVTITAQRLHGTSQRIELTPLPQHLKVSVTPKSGRIRVRARGTEVATAKGRLAADLPSGEITIEVTAPGKNTFERTLFLDRALDLKVRLDPEGQVVRGLGVIGCAGAPKGVALTPDGSEAWTTILNGPPSIEIFDPRTGERMGEVDIGKHGAVEIVFSKDGSKAYASQMETAKVFEIDVKTRKVSRSFKTQSAWTKVVALSRDERTLYAANWSGDDVSEIDLESGKLRRRIPVADTPRGLWPSADGTTLWVASFGVGHLERVDLLTGRVKKVFTGGGALRHLVADEKRGVLFSSDMGRDCVWMTNMKTGKTKRFTTVGHKPNTIDLSPDGRVLFVSNRGENNAASYYLPGPEWGSIMVLDAKTGEPLDGIVGGNQCTALDVSGDGKTLVFSDFLDDRLRVYEVPDYTTLATGNGGRSATLARDVMK